MPAIAAPFTISTASTTAQTLGSGSGQTGSVTSTGSLTVSGSAVAVTISGNNATLTNLGIITQSGSGRAVRDSTTVNGLTINNGSASNTTATMQTINADVVQMQNAGSSITVNNFGTMTSNNSSAGGNQVVDLAGITTGSNTVNNGSATNSSALMQATSADAVRPGVNGVVNNYGRIVSTAPTGSSSDGVDVQGNTGVVINNFSTGVIQGGRSGVAGGAANAAVSSFTTTINNGTGGKIQGDNGSGINLDGFNANHTATIVNNGTITGNGVTGDGDGVDVDGPANITNTGTILSKNSVSATDVGLSEGITIGGGTVTNSGTIQGSVASGNTNAVGRGISFLGNDSTSIPGTREPIYANANVINQAGGTIIGDTDSAIIVEGPASGFNVNIDNQAGALIKGGLANVAGYAINAAIKTGADNDTITNAGTIDGSSAGKAIDLGAASDLLNLRTGSVVLGSMDGGSGFDTLNLGGNGTFGGAINFESLVFGNNAAWTATGTQSFGSATLASGATLSLGGASAALYLGQLIGFDIQSGVVQNVIGNGFNVFYDALLNTDLWSRTYALTNGGFLIASNPVPLPASFSLFAAGLLMLAAWRRDTRG